MENLEIKKRVPKPLIGGTHYFDGSSKEMDFVDFSKFQTNIHPQVADSVISEKEAIKTFREGKVIAKVGTAQETFWAIVEDISNKGVLCRVDNHLVFGDEHGIIFGDKLLVPKSAVGFYVK